MVKVYGWRRFVMGYRKSSASVDFGPGMPIGTVIGEDLDYPDCVYVEVLFHKAVNDYQLRHAHRILQKFFKANFPLDMRVKKMDYPNHYGFVGTRPVSEKEAKKHDTGQYFIPDLWDKKDG
jgi:hypothetical protein